jgi:hypothetical protein
MPDLSRIPTPPLYQAVPVLEAQPAAPPAPDVALDPPRVAETARGRGLLAAAWRLVKGVVGFVGSVLEWLLGAAALAVGLAVLAALPVLQFLSLGYLLEAGGRVARTGRLRAGFIGVRAAARLGGIVAACWLFLLPLRIASQMARAAQVIDPGGAAARNWRVGLSVLIGLTALHVAAACARGGRLRYFLWPFNVVWLARRILRGGYYSEARDAVWDAVVALRLPYYFWLGLRGFVAAMAWLILPVTLLVVGHAPAPLAPLAGWLGALLLAFVLLYLPFLQMRMAEQNRLAAAFEWRAARADFRRAPWLFALAFLVTVLSALPLYLLKIEMVPREAAWLPSLAFVTFIFPARLLTGRALARARRREEEGHWFFRWTGRLAFLPPAALYLLVVYFTQFTSWNGIWSLYEQHAFLVPVPFFGL